MTAAYDDIPYPSAARVQTHPLRMSALAHLLGQAYAPFAGRWRSAAATART